MRLHLIVALFAALISSILIGQITTGGRVTTSGGVTAGAGGINVVVLADEHIELQAWVANSHTPAEIVNRVRALKPDYILGAGDFGNNSVPWEYAGYFTQSSTAVTAGIATTVTINSSPSYSEFGNSPGTDNYNVGYTDTPCNGGATPCDIANTSWVSIYDDNLGSNFEMVQVSSVTHTTLRITTARNHPTGFLMRSHALSPYWDYMLQGRFSIIPGNHDVRCLTGTQAGACTTPPGTDQGPVNLLQYFQPSFWNTLFTGKSYYAASKHPLFAVIGVDNLAAGADGNHYPGDGTAYGSVQELALRPYLNGSTSFSTPWVFSMQHFQPIQICGSYATKWMAGTAVDVALFGHTHMSQMYLGPNCPTMSGSNCSTKTRDILYIDTSHYAHLDTTWDPLSQCESPVGTAAPGQYCSGCTRIAVNSWKIDNNSAHDINPKWRGFTLLQLSQHQLIATNYDWNGNVITDYITGTPATWTLTK